MSKRLQVVVDDAELRRFQRAARRQGVNLSEWVRRALREAERSSPSTAPERKIDAIRAATSHDFPTTDIDEMLADIERGYPG
ncbi:MAG: ribbon-helix-helix protein, CopG family [Acidimicrobiia bacterium]|nr:ribbon-helix-helix protein, CopG family [Acidimicrobiia bacterium]